jgi:hypothetical protein
VAEPRATGTTQTYVFLLLLVPIPLGLDKLIGQELLLLLELTQLAKDGLVALLGVLNQRQVGLLLVSESQSGGAGVSGEPSAQVYQEKRT